MRLPADLLEKGELVARVSAWLEEERTAAEERDIMEREEREQEARERREREEQERERVEVERPVTERELAESEDAQVHGSAENVEIHDDQQHPPPPQPPPRTTPAERSGLCVICQDQEANIAIVDCGHLAMCRACSDLVLASSRECPLCRTRIVTEARLLRIFKT